MKSVFIGSICLLLLFVVSAMAQGQYNWKLSKDKDGIKVYLAEVAGTALKAVKVECILEGTFDKLIDLIESVERQKEWVYNNKYTYLVKKMGPHDLYYHAETSMPWPITNRDAVVHLMVATDSLPRVLNMMAISEAKYLPENSGKVRVPHSSVSWRVTMPTGNSLQIVYTFEANPGGSLPAWLVNMFADKGPYESFKKLAAILKG